MVQHHHPRIALECPMRDWDRQAACSVPAGSTSRKPDPRKFVTYRMPMGWNIGGSWSVPTRDSDCRSGGGMDGPPLEQKAVLVICLAVGKVRKLEGSHSGGILYLFVPTPTLHPSFILAHPTPLFVNLRATPPRWSRPSTPRDYSNSGALSLVLLGAGIPGSNEQASTTDSSLLIRVCLSMVGHQIWPVLCRRSSQPTTRS